MKKKNSIVNLRAVQIKNNPFTKFQVFKSYRFGDIVVVKICFEPYIQTIEQTDLHQKFRVP